MEDSIERANLIKTLFAGAQRVVRPEWIAAAVKATAGLSIVEMVDACDVVDKSPEWPQKLGATIYKIAMEKRNQSAAQKHEEYKGADMFERYHGPKARFFRLLKKTNILIKRKLEPNYSQYWEMVNSAWLSAIDDKARSDAMNFAEKLFAEITGTVKIDEMSEPLKMEVAV